MRVLFVYPFCGLGGVETSILNKIDALQADGVDAAALFGAFYGSGGSALAWHPRVSVGLDRANLNAVIGTGVDAVIVVDFPDLVDVLNEQDIVSPVIFETHASLPAAVAKFHRNLNHPKVAAIVTPSAFNKRMVDAVLNTEKPVVVIPNPIDRTRFSLRPRSAPMLFGLPSNQPTILWVGRLEDEKNPSEFIEISARVCASGLTNVHFLIVGDAFDKAEYLAYAERLHAAIPPQWTNRFSFVRSIPYDEMANLYSVAAQSGGCLVSTSMFESVPMVFIEAMACECPVVGTDVGGVGELIHDGKTGRLYTPGDIDGAALAVRGLIAAARVDERDSITRSALAAVVERNAPSAVSRKYRELIQSLGHSPSTSVQRSAGRPERTYDTASGAGLVAGLVSTIIPVYNRPRLLEEAVASVLDQTYDNIEIIIVDDGSTDETLDVCDRLEREHPSITILHVSHCGRAGLVREAGRRVARGEFIQYLDSDDLLFPTKFAEMVALLEQNPECDIAYCYTRRYRLGTTPADVPAVLTGETFLRMFPDFLSRRFWVTSTPLYRRRICDRIGPWSDLLFWEDIEYDTRLAVHQPLLCHCRQFLTDVRDHDLGRLSGARLLDEPDMLAEAVRGKRLIYKHVQDARLPRDNEHLRSFVDDVRLIHRRCVELGLPQQANDCAAIMMDATGNHDIRSLGEFNIKATIEPKITVLTLRPSEAQICPVLVTNHSNVSFHGADFATELSYHLLDADGSTLRVANPVRVVFDEPLHPAESRLVDLWIKAPVATGLYYLELDILWAGHQWLSATGNPRRFIKLLVSENTREKKWRLHLEGNNLATLHFPPGELEIVRLAIRASTTATRWHIQLNYEPVSVTVQRRYVVAFYARSDEPRQLAVAVSRAHDPWDSVGLYREIDITSEWQHFELDFVASATDERARIHFDSGGSGPSVDLRCVNLLALPGGQPEAFPPFALPGRLRMDFGVEPISRQWGTDRGLPIHRYYLEQFLAEFDFDIHGHTLEFQDPQYAFRFGGTRIAKLDILHIDDSNPLATVVADLTQPNGLASDQFDCIVCTHVLHVILDVDRAIAELWRILKPGGVLLVAVPHISMDGLEYQEVWRFTPHGLTVLLARRFGVANVQVRAYGNSLTAAGEIRGVVMAEFQRSELEHHDPRFPVEVCARAIKTTSGHVRDRSPVLPAG